MSGVQRIDPRRPLSAGPNGLRRIELRKRATSAAVSRERPLRTMREPKSWHLAVVHSDRGSLDDHAHQAIAAAAILAGPETGVVVAVLGALSDDLAAVGADAIAVYPELDASRFQPGNELATVLAVIEKFAPDHIFMPDNARGDGDLGRRLIAHLGNPAATHVVEIDEKNTVIKWSAGAALATGRLPRVVLLDAGAVDTAVPFAGTGKLLDVTGIPDTKSPIEDFRDLGIEAAHASGVALEEADFIVSAGNGVRNVATLNTLAQSLGASVGASRVAVDEGRFTRDKQIGATGKTVSASAYVAIGISGAVQHLQGIKDCRHVIAINTDAGAPIVKRADLTIIGDAENVMQALITRISQARAQREIAEDT